MLGENFVLFYWDRQIGESNGEVGMLSHWSFSTFSGSWYLKDSEKALTGGNLSLL